MSAPKGNNYNMKFKTSKERVALCDKWCKHLEKGYSKESFPECDPQTIRSYMKKYPKDFDTEKLRRAEATHRVFWEEIGISGAMGKLQGFNASSWIFNMKNRFGWRDKQDVTTDGEKLPSPILGGSTSFTYEVSSDDSDGETPQA